MKKLLVVIFIAIMAFTLAACGNNSGSTQKEVTQTGRTDSSTTEGKSNLNTAKKYSCSVLFADWKY